EDLLLQIGIKIDQYISAGEEIDVRNGGILAKIAAPEDYQAANLAVDAQQTFSMKILLAPFGTDPANRIEGVLTASRGIQGVVIDVSGVNLDVILLDARSEVLREQNCDGIRLFPAGTTGTPGTK